MDVSRVVFLAVVAVLMSLVMVAPAAAQSTPPDYEPLRDLAIDVGGIAFIVGLLIFLVKSSLPDGPRLWLFDERPWLVNSAAIILSMGISVMGAWLNLMQLEPRSVVEYVWRGLFSAAVATLGYEFGKNLGRNKQESD